MTDERSDEWYASLEFVRAALPSDDRIMYTQGGTLWRAPDETEHWLHPTTVQRVRLVDKARTGVDAEQARLNDQREAGGFEDPMFSEVKARQAPPRQRPTAPSEPAGAFMHEPVPAAGPLQGPVPSNPLHEVAMDHAIGKLDAEATGGQYEGWAFHLVGDQVALDNGPAVKAGTAQFVGHKSIVVPAALVRLIADTL